MALGNFVLSPGVDLKANSLDEVSIDDSDVSGCTGFQVIVPVASHTRSISKDDLIPTSHVANGVVFQVPVEEGERI